MEITVIIILKIISITIPLLISVAYFTVAERKMMGAIQRRRGPNVDGFIDLLQAFSDGLKLFVKKITLPSNSNISVFLLAPILSFLLSLIGWAVIPFPLKLVLADINLGILYLFSIFSFTVYGIVLAGWSSNSKYDYLKGLKSAAQTIFCEIFIEFVVFLTFYVLSVLVLYYFSLLTIESSVVSDNLAFFNQFLLEILLNRTNLPEFESIFDQSKTICEHLNIEKLNSSSSAEDSNLITPEVLDEEDPDFLIKLEEKYHKLLAKDIDEKYLELLKHGMVEENSPELSVEKIEKKYLDLLDKEIVQKYRDYLSKLKAKQGFSYAELIVYSLIFLVVLNMYCSAVYPEYYD